jgi:hypothetical protein
METTTPLQVPASLNRKRLHDLAMQLTAQHLYADYITGKTGPLSGINQRCKGKTAPPDLVYVPGWRIFGSLAVIVQGLKTAKDNGMGRVGPEFSQDEINNVIAAAYNNKNVAEGGVMRASYLEEMKKQKEYSKAQPKTPPKYTLDDLESVLELAKAAKGPKVATAGTVATPAATPRAKSGAVPLFQRFQQLKPGQVLNVESLREGGFNARVMETIQQVPAKHRCVTFTINGVSGTLSANTEPKLQAALGYLGVPVDQQHAYLNQFRSAPQRSTVTATTSQVLTQVVPQVAAPMAMMMPQMVMQPQAPLVQAKPKPATKTATRRKASVVPAAMPQTTVPPQMMLPPVVGAQY